MLDLSTCLKYYKRKEIQEELVFCANDRELGIKYADGGFGKRPDTLQYKADVLELAKQGVTSFHISEEHWKNPLALSTSLSKKELNKMRKGWDLIIDIDCVDWELSKRIVFVIVKILKKHKISSISCKFSGNKGFHIGVPLEAFPKRFQGNPISELFPDGVKRIMKYIVYIAERDYSQEILAGLDVKLLSNRLKIKVFDILQQVCSNNHVQTRISVYHYLCRKCGENIKKDRELEECPKCKSRRLDLQNMKKCKCGSTEFRPKINLQNVLGLDEILISPRHLYRMAYSLHEKSGLVSLPINPFSVLAFEKVNAEPENVKVKYSFLDPKKAKANEASDLLFKAFEYKPEIKEEAREAFTGNFDMIEDKIPVELFPPCILKISSGLKDGRKRGLFVLINFLTSAGWGYQEITEYISNWNKKNHEQLRETVIKGQIQYHKNQRKKVLPPNCSNKLYYADLGVCCPDELCRKVKNPINYSKRRVFYLKRNQKKSHKSN